MGNLKKIGIALIISILTQVTHASTLIYGPAAAKAFRGSEKGSYAVIFASYKVKQNALHHKGMLIKAHIPHVHIFIKNNIYSVVASPIHSAAVVREIGNKTLSKEVFHPSLLRTNRPMVVVLPHPQRTIFHLKQDELSRKQEVHLSSFKNIKGHAVVQFGGYLSYQGKQQFSAMDGLKGDIYTVSRHSDGNGLVGLAYLFTDPVINKVTLHYGINAFFLASTSVTGQVIQEKVYPNLSYHYHITHFPLYATAKAIIHKTPQYGLTIDAGMGPNFMRTGHFRENSLDGITNPDNPFSGRLSTKFSATAGIGITINPARWKVPLECGYRFFYLGQGSFNQNTSQIFYSFKTGDNYANALLCSVTI